MTAEPIVHDILIDAAPQTVYDVVSRPEHISTWFSDDADITPVLGATGLLTWTETAEQPRTSVEITVVTADPPHAFAFSWVAPDRRRNATDGDQAILVTFKITLEAGRTRLTVTETGLDAVDWDAAAQQAYINDHNQGWTSFLPRLGAHAEGLTATSAG